MVGQILSSEPSPTQTYLSPKEPQILSTPGRRRALKALGAKRRSNLRRVAAGKSPVVAGKKVSARSLGPDKDYGQGALETPQENLVDR